MDNVKQLFGLFGDSLVEVVIDDVTGEVVSVILEVPAGEVAAAA